MLFYLIKVPDHWVRQGYNSLCFAPYATTNIVFDNLYLWFVSLSDDLLKNHTHFLLYRNPALEDQACDRVYRMGQKKEVSIHKFVCKETIEERILALQKKKSQLASDVLAG